MMQYTDQIINLHASHRKKSDADLKNSATAPLYRF